MAMKRTLSAATVAALLPFAAQAQNISTLPLATPLPSDAIPFTSGYTGAAAGSGVTRNMTVQSLIGLLGSTAYLPTAGGISNGLSLLNPTITGATLAGTLAGNATVNLGTGSIAEANSGAWTGGTLYGGDASDQITGGATDFINSIQGTYTPNATTYPGGLSGYGCVLSVAWTNGATCFYGNVTANNASGGVYGVAGVAHQGTSGAQVFGGVFEGQSFAGATGGAAHGAYIGISRLDTAAVPIAGAALEASAYGAVSGPAGAAIAITNENSTSQPGFYKGVYFNLQNSVSASTQLTTYAFITDDAYPATNTGAELTTSHGVLWDQTSFTTSEYAGPSFMVGPTVAGYNARVEVTGSASGAPGITVVGAGATPATNANLDLSALGTGMVAIAGDATVSGTASLNGGGAMAGTFSGTPTFSGKVDLAGGGTFGGTWAGSPALSINNATSGASNTPALVLSSATAVGLQFLPDSTAAYYNPLIAANDQAIVNGGASATTNVLTIAPWSATRSGLRLLGDGHVYAAVNTLDDGAGNALFLTMTVGGTGAAALNVTNGTTTNTLDVTSAALVGAPTGGIQGPGTVNAVGYYTNGVLDPPPPLSATSASIGGSALVAGACSSTATTVTGAAVGNAVVATPNTYPGAGNIWNAYVSAANTVTTEVCAIVAATPTASTYNIRVLN